MKGHSIIVTDADMDRLSRLIRDLKPSRFRDQLQLQLLEETLESAEVRSSEHIPRGMIKMNSRIRVLDLGTGKQELYTLVFPDNADILTSRLSVLAPVGIALLGHREGDIIEAKVPGGARRLKIEFVLQGPEMTRRQARPDRSNKRKLRSARTTQMMTPAA